KGFETETTKTEIYQTGDFCAYLNKNAVRTFEFINNNFAEKRFLLIDARPANRFKSNAPEPREGLRSGTIPNSINIPFDSVLENGKFKTKNKLITLFNNSVVNNLPLIFSCGSGVTACIVLLASELVLENDKSIYDGSWTEWAEKYPIQH
ncbi:MAG: rhodanese-like domain-containing protein, partial [Leeuwenhoekiella sp.]